MLRRAGMIARLGVRYQSQKAVAVEVNKQGIAVLRLDCPGEVQNTLSMDLIQEFDEVRALTQRLAARPRSRKRKTPVAKPDAPACCWVRR